MALRFIRLERDSVFAPDPAPRPVPWVTWSIAASIVLVFLVQCSFYWRHHDDVIGQALAFSPRALAQHRYWTLLTYAWAHAVDIFGYPGLFWVHVGFNLLSLLWFGPAVEEILGRWRYLGLYLGGAVAGALTWQYLSPPQVSADGIIGASGAVYAVISALGTLAPSDWELIVYPFVLPLGRKIRLVVFAICAVEVLPIFFHWMPDVAHWAHLGGAAFGFLYVLILRRFVAARYLSN